MVDNEFAPSLWHPYYFIRKGLFSKIKEHQHFLSGYMLDFGCGSKPYKDILHVDKYIGVDFENEGHSHQQEQIDIFYDGKTIPLENNTFDCILTSEVFEHIFNLEDILKELNRVLKPNGKMLITCPFVWKEHEIPHDFARYTQYALKYLLEKNGFKIDITDKSGNFIEVIFQLQVLYFFDSWYPKLKKVPLIKQLSQFFFIFLPNAVGTFLSKIFPKKKSMYLNNVIIASKCQ